MYPGLWARLLKFGVPRSVTRHQPPELSESKPKDMDASGQPTFVFLAIEVEDTKLGLILRIVCTVRLIRGRWTVQQKYFAFHCGPSGDADDAGEVYFRIDRDRFHGDHYHLRGEPNNYGDDRVPHENAVPSLVNTDPPFFMDLVERFVGSGCKVLPIKRKP